MEANELRIGNWILAKGWDEDFGGNIVGDSEGDEYTKVDSNVIKYIDEGNTMTHYEPVPLSPEILEACGFIKHQFITGYEIDSMYGILCFIDGGWQIYDNDDGYVNNPIKYLHQLQNLYFALCGEELKIDGQKIASL